LKLLRIGWEVSVNDSDLEDRLTFMNLHTALATRFTNFSREIVLCSDVWSLIII